MIKIISISVISFGLGAALSYSLFSNNDLQDVIVKESSVTDNRPNNNLAPASVYADYIRQLEELNRELTNDLAAARKGQATRSDIKDDIKEGRTDTAAVDLVRFEEYYQARKNSEEFSQYLQNTSGPNGQGYAQDMASKFEAEAVDSQWAADYESRLQNLLASNELSGSVVPQSVTCKSRRCQIQVAVADLDQANQVMQSFSEAVGKNKLSIDNSMVVSAPDIDKGVVNLYIARDANVKIHE